MNKPGSAPTPNQAPDLSVMETLKGYGVNVSEFDVVISGGKRLPIFGPGNLSGKLEFISEEANRASEEAARAESEHYNATHDHKTGLLNSRGAEELLEGTEPPVAILMMDGDNFGMINKVFLEDRGDKMLKDTADMLVNSVRPDDVVVRTGGDEFMIFLMDDKRPDSPKTALSPEEVIKLTEGRIDKNTQDLVNHPDNRDLQDANIKYGASVAGAVWHKGMTLNDLKEIAGGAMQARKAAKKIA